MSKENGRERLQATEDALIKLDFAVAAAIRELELRTDYASVSRAMTAAHLREAREEARKLLDLPREEVNPDA